MSDVIFHVYDVTNNANAKTNNAILQLNKVMRDGIGLGGIFHGAIEVYGEEWSFGYCENGTGIFTCPPKGNPMYTYRESMLLGHTSLSQNNVNRLLANMKNEWPGHSYDVLSKNCNHFCDAFCEKLGVQKLPAWVNRFANVGDAAIDVAENTILRLVGPTKRKEEDNTAIMMLVSGYDPIALSEEYLFRTLQAARFMAR